MKNTQSPKRNHKILLIVEIVEDEQAYANLLHKQLTAKRYKVILAKDGFEGLKMALSAKPDLIVLDLLLPVVSGLDMLKALRKFKWGETVPVVILTNVNESGEISEAMNSKVSKYVVKSDVKLEDLIENIEILLNRR